MEERDQLPVKPNQNPIESFKSINEFSKIVGVPAQTIRRMVKEGKLPTLPRGEKHVLIPLNAGAERLVDMAKTAMNEKYEAVIASSPVLHLVQPSIAKSKPKHKGRMPDSIRLGREAR